MLVTGFGPFLSHEENPSAVLASDSGQRFEVLEVSYRAVDEFLDSLDPGSFDAWLALGLAAKATTMLSERVGRNWIAAVPDVRGEVHGPGVIDPTGPPLLSASWVFDDECVESSVDAGGYLCNYVLYRALRRFPEKRIAFLHVPPFSVVGLEEQQAALRRLLGG